MHLLFCAHLINIFLFFRSVELRYFIHPKCLGVSGLCNLRLQQCSFLHIQTLYVMIARTLSTCAPYILCTLDNIFGIVELGHYYVYTTFGVLTLFCNSNRFHSFIFKLCIMIVHTLKMCTQYFAHI